MWQSGLMQPTEIRWPQKGSGGSNPSVRGGYTFAFKNELYEHRIIKTIF